MNKLFSVIKNIFSIEELKSRIFTTVGFLIIFRLGSFVVLPGIDPSKLQSGYIMNPILFVSKLLS